VKGQSDITNIEVIIGKIAVANMLFSVFRGISEYILYVYIQKLQDYNFLEYKIFIYTVLNHKMTTQESVFTKSAANFHMDSFFTLLLNFSILICSCIWGSHGRDYKRCCCLGCKTV
jgi:hypothetical protein